MVGGGNSAGQAAVFLAETARRVHMLVRSSGLKESMSRYLIRRIEESPTIVLRTNTEITALAGSDHLERVTWRNNQSGTVETHNIGHVFTMTGLFPMRTGSMDVSLLTARGLSRPEQICLPRIWPPRTGRSRDLLTCSKPVCPECSR